ncbi:MAG: DNA polymerase Y family protein, partial [Rubrivivax sp.]
ARLGDAQVLRLEAVADHRPEHASRSVPATGAPVAVSAMPMPMSMPGAVAALQTLPLHRPVWLLPEPLPLAERQMLPLLNGQPLQPVSGPERIESGWWDGPPAVRDYFIVQDADGALLWIYRNRLPDAPSAGEPTWFLQGRFG